VYEEYWGLKEPPFENVPDPNYFYKTEAHEEAMKRLIYAVERRKGACMLTGEVGCGKTMVSRVFIQELSDKKYEIALIANPSLDPIDFLKEIVYQLGIDKTADSKVELLRLLNNEMLENMNTGKDTVIIVDEAQAIEDVRTFEELRLLLNFQLNERFLLTLVLIGQPEFKEKVSRIKQLDQRISIRYHIKPLDFNDTARYIIFRLKKAGLEENIFTKEAVEKIYGYTNGVPRMINVICDLSLLVGCSSKARVIDSKLAQKVIDDAQ
jgi:general secretion pathway protein A